MFARLLAEKWIDGEIINSFFIALQEIVHKNGMNLLAVDSYFSEKLIAERKSIGFENWAKRVRPSQFDIWLLPVLLRGSHWVLLVIIFSQRVMVYFDLCQDLPPENLLNRVCSFIASSRSARTAKFTHWNEWKISAPTDIPYQKTENGEITGNCGMHVCIRAYIIVSNTYTTFGEKHMDMARKGLATFLVEYPIKRKEALKRIQMNDDMFSAYDTVAEMKNLLKCVKITRNPPLYFATTFEFAASIKVLGQFAKHKD